MRSRALALVEGLLVAASRLAPTLRLKLALERWAARAARRE